MSNQIELQDFAQYLVSDGEHPFNQQLVFLFENDFGASVIRGFGTYGSKDNRFELAVIQFDGDDWDITYSTPITDDVLGWLDANEVISILAQIRTLPRIGNDVIDGVVQS